MANVFCHQCVWALWSNCFVTSVYGHYGQSVLSPVCMGMMAKMFFTLVCMGVMAKVFFHQCVWAWWSKCSVNSMYGRDGQSVLSPVCMGMMAKVFFTLVCMGVMAKVCFHQCVWAWWPKCFVTSGYGHDGQSVLSLVCMGVMAKVLNEGFSVSDDEVLNLRMRAHLISQVVIKLPNGWEKMTVYSAHWD